MIVRRTSGWPKWNLGRFEDLDRMKHHMDRLFGDLVGRYSREPKAGVFPLTNVTEGKDAYYVRAELPGVTAQDLEITITDDNLSISGERKIRAEKNEAKYHRREREAGKFSRMITLPGQVDSQKVEASCANGILTVILPKAESAKPRQISVKAS
jgi:HSP20 family protein